MEIIHIEIDPMKELQEWGIEFSQSTMKMDYIFLKLKSQISWKIHNLCAPRRIIILTIIFTKWKEIYWMEESNA